MPNPILILSGIPGCGKTKYIEKKFKQNPNIKKIYLTVSHTLLNERKINLTGQEITHWQGMKRICPLRFEEPIKSWIEINAPVKWICEICLGSNLISLEDCPHKNQFLNPSNLVIAPIEYLFSGQVADYNPSLIVVDDVISKLKKIHSKREMNIYISYLKALGFLPFTSMKELFEEKGDNLLYYLQSYLIPKIKSFIKQHLDEHDIFTKDDIRQYLLPFDPMEIYTWYRFVKKHGWKEEFAIPMIMKVFELAVDSNREVMIVGANLNESSILNELASEFEKEYEQEIFFKYEKIKINNIAKSIIYRCRCIERNDAWYPAGSSIVKGKTTTCVNIKKRNGSILTTLTKSVSTLQIGLIHPKNSSPRDFIPKKVEDEQIRTLTFGNLRGNNSLEKCDVLFVVGTFKVNKGVLEYNYKLTFHKQPFTQSKKGFDGGYFYIDPEMEKYRQSFEDEEMYQAIHRVRPALNSKKIFVFGLVPDAIYKEFEVKDLYFKKDEYGNLHPIECDIFKSFFEKQVGDNGIFQYELIKKIKHEFPFWNNGEVIRRIIVRHLTENSDKYMTVKKRTINNRIGKFIIKNE